MKTTKLAVIISLTALSIATNYALIGVYNVKLMDFIVFISGFCFGPMVGAFVGVLSWTIYGTLNPHGFVLSIWLATMFSETIYGLVGGFLGRNFNSLQLKKEWKEASVFFAILGVMSTLIYDVVTNIVFGLSSGINVIIAIFSGFFPFGLVHVVSNAIFFAVGSVPAISAIETITGGEHIVSSTK
jgi:uncharacterized membrane protein